MQRAVLGAVLALALAGLDSARAQDETAPGADVAATHSATPGIPAFPEPPAGDPRSNIPAPARVPIHAGAKIGDWLERVRTRQRPEGVIKERTTIAGRVGKLWIIDRTGTLWLGRSLRLICADDGRVVAAAAATPGDEDLVALKIQAEPAMLESAPVELDTAIGKVKALRQRVRVGAHADDVATRLVGAAGAFEGVFLGREFDHDGRKTVERIAGLEEAKLGVGATERPCFKLTLETTVNDAPKGTRVEVWLSKTPLFFGEHVLRRKDSLVEEKVEQGSGGTPAFPLPR